MTVELTKAARLSAAQTLKKPSLIVEFDGIDTKIGSARIYRTIRIGDDGLLVGDTWEIGGKMQIPGLEDRLSFNADFGHTSTRIDFKLDPDRGIGSSVSTMDLAIVDDAANTILTLVSQYEMLGRKVLVWLSPNADTTTFSEDYIVIFRGIVDNIEASPGGVLLTLSHPDQKKRQSIYTSFEGTLNGLINNSTTSISLTAAPGSSLLTPINGPSGVNDTSLKFYVRIDDEVIKYTGTSGPTLTGVARAQLGTTGASHSDQASVSSFYTLAGAPTDLALKLMLSGWGTYYKTGVAFTSIEDPTIAVDNSIYFEGIDLNEKYGLTAGDYLTVSGCTNGANNVTLKVIEDVVDTDTGTYLTVSGVTFTTEVPPSSAVVAFRSKYDTLADGLMMSPDEVDVTEHERLNTLFLSGFSYSFYLKDSIDSGKEFIEQQVYSPIACYSIPRKARASVGYHIGPLPTTSIKILDETNVKTPSKIVKKRSLGRNFYNTIIYKFDQDVLTDKFLQGDLYTNGASRLQIPVGTKALTIEANGLRSAATAQTNANRRLNRYAFGAEYFTQVRTLFKDGFNIEVGDLVLLDGSNLKISDFTTGTRDNPAKLYEVVSKSLDISTGDVSLELTDTNYSTASRYALISPASKIKSGTSGTQFVIKESFSSVFDTNEYLKWDRFLPGLTVNVRNDDFSVSATAAVSSFAGNTVHLSSSLGFTPSADMIMEMTHYTDETDRIHLIYGFMSSGGIMSNGDTTYRMI